MGILEGLDLDCGVGFTWVDRWAIEVDRLRLVDVIVVAVVWVGALRRWYRENVVRSEGRLLLGLPTRDSRRLDLIVGSTGKSNRVPVVLVCALLTRELAAFEWVKCDYLRWGGSFFHHNSGQVVLQCLQLHIKKLNFALLFSEGFVSVLGQLLYELSLLHDSLLAFIACHWAFLTIQVSWKASLESLCLFAHIDWTLWLLWRTSRNIKVYDSPSSQTIFANFSVEMIALPSFILS